MFATICCFGGVYTDGIDTGRYSLDDMEWGDAARIVVPAMTEAQLKVAWESMQRKWNAGVKYVSETDYRTHYINNSLSVYDEPVIISHHTISDFYFEKIMIPVIFETSHVNFVTDKSDSRIVEHKHNVEELDFAAVADFGKYWNPTEGLFQYGAGFMAYTYPDLTISDYDYSVVAYGAMNDGWVNPFVKNIYHFTGAQKNCYEIAMGLANEYRAENTARIGYELTAYYRRYSDRNMGFTNADAAIYVGYGKFIFKVRYVPFLDEDVLRRQFGSDWTGFSNDVEFFLSYQAKF